MLWAEFWGTLVLFRKTPLEKSTTFDPLAFDVPTVTLMSVTAVGDKFEMLVPDSGC